MTQKNSTDHKSGKILTNESEFYVNPLASHARCAGFAGFMGDYEFRVCEITIYRMGIGFTSFDL